MAWLAIVGAVIVVVLFVLRIWPAARDAFFGCVLWPLLCEEMEGKEKEEEKVGEKEESKSISATKKARKKTENLGGKAS